MTFFELYSIRDKALVKEWKTCPPNASFSMAGLHHRIWQVGDKLYYELGGNGGSAVKEISNINENPWE